MEFFSMKRLKAGVEISIDKIKSALIFRKGNGFSIHQLSHAVLPAGIVKPSFKTENILDEMAFQAALKKVLKDITLKKINLSLPDASVKVLIRKFKELPKEPEEINEMVLWNISRFLDLPIEALRISWENMGKNSDHDHVLLIALGLEKVIAQYEEMFRQIGVVPVMVAPAGLNQFNFYAPSLPEKGKVAYLGLFDDFLNIFAFSDNIPVFYKTIKKGLIGNDSGSAVNDVDLLIQYYNSENPDLEIEKFFVASHIKSDLLVEHILQDVSQVGPHIDSDMLVEHLLQDGKHIDFQLIDERQLIEFDKKFKDDFKDTPLSFYTTVIGTAQGI
jgi:hypothetical protein